MSAFKWKYAPFEGMLASMIILSIETSCDETAISIIETSGEFPHATYSVRGDALNSQAELHREYGGVFPTIAKREHAATLIPMLEKALEEARLPSVADLNGDTAHTHRLFPDQKDKVRDILSREETLAEALLAFHEHNHPPAIDLIAVTQGPGLEPALWVGISFAKALSYLWNAPLIGVNHMEGHIFSSLFADSKITPIVFPALALLISGGHTEIVLSREWGSYELIGKTRDDAVGEAFDKVARTLGLPYPGGPEISKRARAHREKGSETKTSFPRPMLTSNDCDFSFSGIKTAVLYHVKKLVGEREITEDEREEISRAFEDAVTEVLLKKCMRAINEYGAKTLILGGGVSANQHIRTTFAEELPKHFPDLALFIPSPKLTTDNAVMIALAAHARYALGHTTDVDIVADGNLSVSSRRA